MIEIDLSDGRLVLACACVVIALDLLIILWG